MKNFNKLSSAAKSLLLSLFIVTGTLLAKDVHLVWDFNPPDENVITYRIYEKINANAGPIYVLVGTVASNVNSLILSNVAPGKHIYVGTASNYWGESLYSDEASTANTNSKPKNLRITN